MIIETVISYVGGILLIIFIPFTIIFNIKQFRAKWNCRKKKYNCWFNRCHEDGCKWARYCENYQHLLTEEEAQHLYKLIEEYQRK